MVRAKFTDSYGDIHWQRFATIEAMTGFFRVHGGCRLIEYTNLEENA